jgi:hypothetical protein
MECTFKSFTKMSLEKSLNSWKLRNKLFNKLWVKILPQGKVKCLNKMKMKVWHIKCMGYPMLGGKFIALTI